MKNKLKDSRGDFVIQKNFHTCKSSIFHSVAFPPTTQIRDICNGTYSSLWKKLHQSMQGAAEVDELIDITFEVKSRRNKKREKN